MIEELLQRYRQGDRVALARLLSLAARGEDLAGIAAALPPASRPSLVAAFTGSGGVGKSSLVGKLIDLVRVQGVTVAVLACDPQSPLTGGALLGDRFRMGSRLDDGVFIRSLAALGCRGALAEHLPLLIRLLEAFGFGVIFLETVGAGQGDTAVRSLADVVVLLLQPESGDDLQWEKAGLLEVADIAVVHKSDLPGADQTAAQVRSALDLSMQKQVLVIKVSSKTGEGIDVLWRTIQECPRRREQVDGAGDLLPPTQQFKKRDMPTATIKIGPQDNGRRMSLDDFDHAKVAEGHNYELSRGVITVSDVPDTEHMAVVLGIKDQFYAFKLAHPDSMFGIAAGSECKLLLADLQSERHPDLSIYKTPPPEYEDVWSIWIPELVIEVVSPGSVTRDHEEKREEYLDFGVKEYWIVDANREEMLILTRFRGKWRERTIRPGEIYESKLFSGFRFDCGAVFRGTGNA
jgi:LAO/AO transport system kinase